LRKETGVDYDPPRTRQEFGASRARLRSNHGARILVIRSEQKAGVFMSFPKRALALMAAVLALVQASTADSITTLFAGNGGPVPPGGALFELRVTKPGGVEIQAMDLNIFGYNVHYGVRVYVTPDTYVGKETNASAWTLVAQASGVSESHNIPAHVDLPDFHLAPGSYGMAVYLDFQRLWITTGTGTNQNFANADISLRNGATMSQFFGGFKISPRTWNGTLYYDGGPPPVTTYCTGWPASPGPAEIEFTGTPSASSANGFTLFSYYNISNTPDPGVLMYGLQGPAAIPFATGGTLCVQGPIERTPVVLVGSPSHDGFQIDMNAYAAGVLGGHPLPALRVPGTVVNCQWWGKRLPPQSFDHMLTNALAYTIEP
jgi:hypothetical protein